MRNVIFDLGGVVLDWNPDRILDTFYDDAEVRAAMKTAMFQHPDWLAMDRGTLTEAEVVGRLEQRSGRAASELTRLLEAVRESLKPKPDTVALLERLAQRGVPLYCLSNMPATTFAYLRDRYAFWPAFRGIVISGEIRMVKPDPEIFRHLLQRYELEPAATVFVDDHAPNVEAARSLGLHTVWFRDAAQCTGELEPLLQPS
jgi:putative hydrolase of the HAD superfamily